VHRPGKSAKSKLVNSTNIRFQYSAVVARRLAVTVVNTACGGAEAVQSSCCCRVRSVAMSGLRVVAGILEGYRSASVRAA